MNREQLLSYQTRFRQELMESCIPFWMEHGWDREKGGVYTFLTREGERCSANKAVWAQGRFLWTLSRLMVQYGANEEWRKAADSCRAFLDAHCVDRDGRMFFLVTGDGKPVRKRRYFFSEAFYIMGFAEYARATGDERCLEKARGMYDFVRRVYQEPQSDPHGVYPKFEPSASMRALAGPMILLNVTSVMRVCDPANAARYDQAARVFIQDITEHFCHEEHHCVFENVRPDGTADLSTPLGRLINPGHAIEAAWFLLHEAKHFGDLALIETALNILKWSLDLGWDREHGGIVYFVDRLGYPPEQSEHDLKLWWPQMEAIIAVLMAYDTTDDPLWAEWFERLTQYAFTHFKDAAHGEWVGYLHADNTWQMPVSKGNCFKGPFHLPRMLCLCDQLLGSMLDKKACEQ